MKAIAGLVCVFVAIGFMFAVVGQPSYSSSDGTTVSYGGTTIMDTWQYEAQQETERTRIAEAQETARVQSEQEQSTIRNRDFWQTFPSVMLSIAAVCAAVGAAFVGVAWSRRPVAPRTVTHVTHNHLTMVQPVAELAEWDFSQGMPPIPDGRRITVSRR